MGYKRARRATLPMTDRIGRHAVSKLVAGLVAALTGLCTLAEPADAAPQHALAMHGEPLYPADFTHFNYVNPNAPKGGSLTWGVIGKFDSTKPFIIKGRAVRGLRDPVFGNNVYESLLTRGHDEPFTLYGLLAETVEVPDDRSWVEFHLRANAKFSDGEPVTVDDVIFSHHILKTKGRGNYRIYYKKVVEVVKVGERGVRFKFADGDDREFPLILGLMPILPKHLTDPDTFEATSLEPPVGSGPYRVAEIDVGNRIILRRDPNYWGRDLAVKRGQDNFDEIRIEYYRDQNTKFEAFKKGIYDVNPEGDPGRWATAYAFPAVKDGRIVKEEVATGRPKGMFGFVYNTRRALFSDVRTREALSFLFDFNWVNKNLYHGLYKRTGSFFEGSELSARGRPADAAETALLSPFPNAVRADILAGRWQPPASDGSGRDRKALRQAVKLLAEAGWQIRDRILTNAKTGEPFVFEILVVRRDDERLALAFKRNLTLIGIDVTIRLVDSAQYRQRLLSFDYDMIMNTWYSSLSPGNEQYNRWSSLSADAPSAFNYAGANSPAIDALIDALLAARDRAGFVSAVRALDRALLSGFYVIPLFHLPDQWIARWNYIRWPQNQSIYGYRPETWWHEMN